ncbi:MAG: radical SAM protein [Promethearchaeota archaeon]
MKVEKVRVSIGSASVLGLGAKVKFKDPPTTCYIMTYKEGHCAANCGFCPQARSSKSSEQKLSRVTWPIFPFKDYLTKLKYLPSSKQFKRICIQTLNYPDNFRDLMDIITQINHYVKIPISVAVPPMSRDNLKELKLAGVQRIGIALDGSTPEIFNRIKGDDVNGPYEWEQHFQKLREALDIFSEGFVSTHLIIGLGETEKDVIVRIEELHKLKILVSLFAFTPIKGTKFETLHQPPILNFRKLQLGRYLIVKKEKNQSDFTFNTRGDIVHLNISTRELKDIIYNTEAFLTSGCPGCNRPYYTSKPSGPIYNFPRKVKESENEEIYNILKRFVNK